MYFLRCISGRYFIWLGLLLVAQAVGITAVCAEPIVSNVRMWEHPDKTRFVVDLSEKVDFKIKTLTDPYRLVINLATVNWQVSSTGVPKKTGVIQNWRNGHFDYKNFNYRIVLDLSGPVIEKVMFLAPDQGNRYRLVVDLMPSTSRAMFQPPSRKPNFLPEPKIVIVIDPGHGGIDPGANTKSGIFEKDVVLAAANVFKKRLERSGKYRVYLTRNRDIFLKLRKRINIAGERKADLFISLHADAMKNKKTRGISVYTLSEKASSKAAEALARQENSSDLFAGIKEDADPIIRNILIALNRRRAKNYSTNFAIHLIKKFRSVAKVLPNPHRQAGFAVLKTPDNHLIGASVLVELGFLSNNLEARALLSETYQARLAYAFLDAVNSYCDQITCSGQKELKGN